MVRMENKSGKKIEKPQETVTLTMVVVFLSAIFIILALFVVYLRYSNFSPLADFYAKKEAAKMATLNDYLTIKLGNRGVGETVELKIIDSQLADIVGVDQTTFPLKKAKLSISDQGITVSGKTAPYFWSLGIEATIEPKVLDNQLHFMIKTMKAGGVKAPSKISDQFSYLITDAFKNVIPAKRNLKIIDAKTIPQYLIIDVEKQ